MAENEDVKKQWVNRDRVTKAITKDGMFRAAVVQATNTVKTAHSRHELEPLGSLVLGRALMGATLMASFLKGEERVVIVVTGDGPLKSVYAEAIQVGEVRGYVVANPDPNAESKGALGAGLLKVDRMMYGRQDPVTGIVELEKGDITSDMSHYLTQSEQVPSAFVMDVLFDEHDLPKQAVGLLMQAMPGAKPEEVFKVYDTLDYLDRLTEFAEKGYSPEEILRQVMPSECDILGTKAVDFFCRCSMDRFKSILLTLGFEEVSGMQKSGQDELICQYCNEKYHLTDADFTEIKEQLLAKRN